MLKLYTHRSTNDIITILIIIIITIINDIIMPFELPLEEDDQHDQLPPNTFGFSTSDDTEQPTSPNLMRDNDLNTRVDTLQSQLSYLTAMMTELLLKFDQENLPRQPSFSQNTDISPSNVSQTPTNSRYTSEESGINYDFLGIDDLLSTPRDTTSIKLSGINALSGKDRM
jgi:hypothetical protein